ncbi:MAG TPA: cation-translocating P-type ATPase, partial [Pricia sp.]|nr:cation-translocating P-type ATPase [Pricia sp.]
MASNNFDIKGLTDKQVVDAREKYGINRLAYKKENGFLNALQSVAKEPMVILLLVTAAIYFISGNTGDAIFMVCAIVLVAGISLYQDSRSRNALEKLKNITRPTCKVIRNGEVQEINSEELVIGDSL